MQSCLFKTFTTLICLSFITPYFSFYISNVETKIQRNKHQHKRNSIVTRQNKAKQIKSNRINMFFSLKIDHQTNKCHSKSLNKYTYMCVHVWVYILLWVLANELINFVRCELTRILNIDLWTRFLKVYNLQFTVFKFGASSNNSEIY